MNRQKFLKSLQALVGWRERAFILALAERAAPNAALYFRSADAFPETFNADDEQLHGLLAEAWKVLIQQQDEAATVDLLDRVVAAVPDTDNVDHYGILPTRDFLLLLEQALLCGLNSDKKRAQEASQNALDTIMQFIEFSEGEGLSENALIKLFDNHPLMEREFSFQNELADTLRAARHPGEDLVAELRELAQDEGVSNIGISLD